MIRFAGLILIFAPLFGCTAQRVYMNHVFMENRCGQPLDMNMSNSSNMHSRDRSLTVAAGDRALVASFVSYGEDVIEQIPDNYQLTINDAAGSKTIDTAQLKNHLIGVKKVTDRTDRQWTIRETSICP